MAELTEEQLEELLFQAVQAVKHRGLMKRPDAKQPMIAKTVTLDGKDWKPCEVCRDETKLIIKELARLQS